MNPHASMTRGRSLMLRTAAIALLLAGSASQAEAQADRVASVGSNSYGQREQGVRSLLTKRKASLDDLEKKEDLEGMAEVCADARKSSPDGARAVGSVYATEHVLVRYVNVPDEYARAAAAIYEVCDASLRKRFGVTTGICTVPGQRLHLHLLAKKGYQLNLWTDPTSVDFPLVIETMPNWRRGLSSPQNGGPHIVYGLCHELGHVLMGWEDCRHQWAHYLGSLLVEDVASELGANAWPQPYNIRAEGLSRFLKEIEGVKPDRATDRGTARIFYDVGESFGLGIWGKALDWIKKNRRGTPFYARRLYRLDDLRDALLTLGCDPEEVRRIFGGSKRPKRGRSLLSSSIQSPYYTRGWVMNKRSQDYVRRR